VKRGASALALALAFTFAAVPGRAEDPPAEVLARPNPLAGDPDAIRRGKGLFLENCAPCHGAAADGRGPGAVGLRPPPADLSGPDVVPRHPDGWLFWRIANGKRGTAMPPFAFALTEAERWSIVSWLRSLQAPSAVAPGSTVGRPRAGAPLASAH